MDHPLPWWFAATGLGPVAVGVLMIVFRVRVARANDWFWNAQWGAFLKVPVESPPVLVVLMACLFFLAGLLLMLIGIASL